MRSIICALKHRLPEIKWSVCLRAVSPVSNATAILVDRMRAKLGLEFRCVIDHLLGNVRETAVNTLWTLLLLNDVATA